MTETEVKYRELFDHMNSGVAVYKGINDGNDFIFVDLNKKGESISKIKREDIVGKSLLETFPGVRSSGLLKVFQEVWKTGGSEHHPVTLYQDERISHWMENYVYKLDSGEIVSIYDDITELKQKEEELRDSEEKYRALVTSGAIGVVKVSIKGEALEYNKKLLDFFGYTAEEFQNKTFMELTHSEDLKADVDLFQELIEGKRDHYNIEKRYIHKEGHIIWGNLSVAIIRDREGNPLYALSLVEDIIEKKKAEQLLENNLEEKTQLADILMDRLPCIALLLRTQTREIVASNSHAKEVGAVPGKKCYATWGQRDDPCPWCLAPKAWETKELQHLEIEALDIVWDAYWVPINEDLYLHYAFDITERKSVEQKLKESEEMFRNLAEQSLMGIAIIQDDIVKYASKRLAEIYGYSVEEMLNFEPNGFLKLIHPDNVKFVKEQARKKQLGFKDVITHFQAKGVKKTGETFWVENFSKTIDYMGRPADFVTNIDITERKKAEQKIQDSEEKYRSFYEHAPLPYQSLDENGIILDVNQAWLDFFEHNREDVVGKWLGDFMVPESRVFFNAKFPQFKKEGTIQGVQYEVVRKNGTHKIISFNGKAGYDPEGNFLRTHCIFEDITEKRRYEQNLKESEEKFFKAFHSGPNLMAITRMEDGYFIDVNKVYIQSLGYNREELIGHSSIELNLWANPEQRNEFIKKLKESNRVEPFEVEINTKSGKKLTMLFSGEVINLNNEPHLITTANDITDRIKAEEKLKESEEKWHTLVEEAPDIIINADHEGRILYINKTPAGITPEEAIGTNVLEYVSPEYEETVKNSIEQVFQTGNPSYFEITARGPYDTISWFSTRLGAIKHNNKVISVMLITRDITERKKVVEKLIESEKQYKYLANELEIIIDHIPGIIVYKDAENNIMRVNKFMADAHNLKKEEMEGKSSFEFYPYEEAQVYWEDDLEVIESKKGKFNIVEPWQTLEGRRWVNTNKIPYIDENGNVNGIIAIAMDITEIKLAEEKIKEQNEFLTNIIESLTHPFYVINVNDYTIEMANTAANFGVLSGDQKCYSLTHQTDKPCIGEHPCPINKVKNTKSPTLVEHVHYDEKGNSRNVDIHGYPIFDENGEVIQMIEYAIDITEHRKAEKKLKESEEKYRSLVESTSDFIWQINDEGKYTYASPRVFDLLGYDPEEIIGKTLFDLMPLEEAQRVGEIFNKSFELQAPFHRLENENVHKDGHHVIIETSGMPIFDTDGNFTGYRGIDRDITERKIAEEKVIKEREKAELYLNLVKVIVVALDNNGIITLMNKQGYEILGYEEGELNGKNWFKTCLPPHERDRVYDYFKKLMNGEMDVIEFYENPIYIKDGHEKLIAWSTVLLKDHNGKITGLLSSGEDITERKKADEKIKEQNEFLTNVIESLTHPFYIINVDDFTIEMANTAANFGELSGDQKCFALTHHNDKQCTGEHPCPINMVKNTKSPVSVEHIHYDERGNPKNIDIHGYPIFDENGEVIQMIEYAIDITEHRKAEQKLIESEEKYRELVETSPNSIMLLDYKGIIIECNKITELLLDLLRKEIIGKSFIELFVKENKNRSRVFETFNNVLNKEIITQLEFEYINKNGAKIYLNNRFSFVKIGGKEYIQFVSENITERKLAENLIKEEVNKLKALDQIKNDFIDRISHELKTPLVSIIGACDLLTDNYKSEMSEKVMEYINIAFRGGNRLKSLVNNLIDASRINDQKLELNKKNENLSTIIKECINDLFALVIKRTLIINMEIEEDVYTDVDRVKIEQVFMNLISNAIKNTPPKGRISIILREYKDYISISIKDTGIGLTEEEKKRLFKKFGKIERYGKGFDVDIDGSGLGLFISKNIVDLHNGTIGVESEGRNKGSTFNVKLPVKNK